MGQGHFIGKINLDFHARSGACYAPDLQEAASRLVNDRLTSALEQLFDRLVPAEEVLRVQRLDIVLPSLTSASWQPDLVALICQEVEKEMERLRLHPLPSELGLLQRRALADNLLEAWLYFLATGRKADTASGESDWQQAALDAVATEVRALDLLRTLLRTHTSALERLVRQHDETFLLRLAEAMSGQSLQMLSGLRQAIFAFISSPKIRNLLLDMPAAGAGGYLPEIVKRAPAFDVFFYDLLFEEICNSTQIIDIQFFAYILLKRVFESPGSAPNFIAQIAAVRLAASARIHKGKTPPASTRISTSDPSGHHSLTSSEGAENVSQVTITQIQEALSVALSALRAPAPVVTFLEEITRRESTAIQTCVQRLLYFQPGSDAGDKARKPTQTMAEAPPSALLSPQQDSDKPLGSQEAHTSAMKTDHAATESTPALQKDDTPAGTSLVVAHAGLVILNPFLKIFFEKVGLIKDKSFVHTDARRRGAQLLHYLSSGATEAAEYELHLAKVLTGLPLDMPLDRVLDISPAEQKECTALLDTVIGYWTALGQCSHEALQEGFLQRPGRLTRRNDGWLLQPETKTLDILLDQLPWGIGIIQSDWMPEFLYVEWF